MDPNTGESLYESGDIIDYLYRTLGGRPPPTRLLRPSMSPPRSWSDAAAGVQVPRPAVESTPAPLELFSFESSPYSRRVRELLCELELPYLLRSTGKARWQDLGPPMLRATLFPTLPVEGRARIELLRRAGKVQVPYLVDPNTGTALFESDAIQATTCSPRMHASTVTLGATDIAVSRLAWGMWRFHGDDLTHARALVEAALDAGINLFDTADIYGFDGHDGFGNAEVLLGQLFAAEPGLRRRMVLASKGGIIPGVPYDSSADYTWSAPARRRCVASAPITSTCSRSTDPTCSRTQRQWPHARKAGCEWQGACGRCVQLHAHANGRTRRALAATARQHPA